MPASGAGPVSSRALERERMVAEYARRDRDDEEGRYAPWNPVERFMRRGRSQKAVEMLKGVGCFPERGDACLEIGHGRLGWLGDLQSWGVGACDLHGVEVDLRRLREARRSIHGAKLVLGDGSVLPWASNRFRLVVLSTVLSSILDLDLRFQICREASRVLAPGGAILVYDFAFNNPRNPSVRKVSSGELRRLFDPLQGEIRSVTLAPPLARRIVPLSRTLAEGLELFAPLRTHRLAVMKKVP